MTRNQQPLLPSRRDLLVRSGYGLGAGGLHVLGAADATAAPAFPNFTPKAKRVIFLFQSGGPSHMTCSTRSRFSRIASARTFWNRFSADNA